MAAMAATAAQETHRSQAALGGIFAVVHAIVSPAAITALLGPLLPE